VEDKKQVTLVVSSTANGNIFPGQVVFTSTTHRRLPPSNEGKLKCINSSWDLTFSEKSFVHVRDNKGFSSQGFAGLPAQANPTT
jgi:hypothetical protein